MSESKAKVMESTLCFAGSLLINFFYRRLQHFEFVFISMPLFSPNAMKLHNVEHSFNYVMNKQTPSNTACHFTFENLPLQSETSSKFLFLIVQHIKVHKTQKFFFFFSISILFCDSKSLARKMQFDWLNLF